MSEVLALFGFGVVGVGVGAFFLAVCHPTLFFSVLIGVVGASFVVFVDGVDALFVAVFVEVGVDALFVAVFLDVVSVDALVFAVVLDVVGVDALFFAVFVDVVGVDALFFFALLDVVGVDASFVTVFVDVVGVDALFFLLLLDVVGADAFDALVLGFAFGFGFLSSSMRRRGCQGASQLAHRVFSNSNFACLRQRTRPHESHPT